MKLKDITHHFGIDYGVLILDNRRIELPVKKNLFGQIKHPNVNLDYLKITLDDYPKQLEIDKNALLQLRIRVKGSDEVSSNDISNVNLKANDIPYDILLNHDAIKDFTDLNLDTVEIKFSIQAAVDGKPISDEEYNVNIKLVKAKSKVDIDFIPEHNLKYVHDNICIGQLKVTNSCQYRFANTAAFSVTLRYPMEFKEEIISFDYRHIEESDPCYESSPGVMSESDKLKSCLLKNRISDQKIELKKIVAKNTVSIPIYLDLNELENPENPEREETFTAIIKDIQTEERQKKSFSVTISRDCTKTSLGVVCNGMTIKSEEESACGHFYWIPYLPGKSERFNGKTELANIMIKNEATNRGVSENAAVILKDISISYTLSSSIEASDNYLQLESNKTTDDIITLKNSVDSKIYYKYTLIHKEIKDIPCNLSVMSFDIDFDYIEDESGIFDKTNAEWKHYHTIIKIELEKDPGSEWLCLDYGTSAIVAVFGYGNKSQLLKLNKRNREILEDVEGRPKNKEENYLTPEFEENDHYLPSHIMLRANTPSVNTTDIKKSLIYLAPSVPRFHSSSYRLPYMKALVGYKDIPNGDLYKDFKYKINLQDEQSYEFKDRPVDVDTVFKSAYNSLFKNYILKCMPEKKSINKMALSIPNTYTPHHIEYLKTMIEQEIKTLRSKDYIWFVSESDAIAYYYLWNWKTLNKNKNVERKSLSLEHILVYDMGAGTLDLTYLTIEHLESGDKSVNMISKIGLNKAGDYLDFIIAKTLVEVHPDLFPKEILHRSEDNNFQRLWGELKYFIKYKLKPELFIESSIKFPDWYGEQVGGKNFGEEELNLEKIRNHPIIQTFLKECTDELFDRFIGVGHLEAEESPIDTLIMTGRSIMFGNIKDLFLQKIHEWNDDDHCVSIEIQGDELKTIVAQGTLYYASLYGKQTSTVTLRNRNIYAKYGVLYFNRQNEWEYQPLIDPQTKPTGKSDSVTGCRNNMSIYTYDTDKYSADENVQYIQLDMRNTVEAYLVQCYSVDPAKDYKNEEKRNDYLTFMVAFNPGSVAQDVKKIHVRLEVNYLNEMTFTAGFTTFEPSAAVKIDVETNSTFKHSMWPYI